MDENLNHNSLVIMAVIKTDGCNIKIGCAGFSYKDWSGSFYPKSLPNKKYLEFYSKYFDIVEINSTFYNLPQPSTLQSWYDSTPDYFRFSVKVWQRITHQRKDEADQTLLQFFNRMKYLEPKIEYYLFQFPPRFKFNEKNARFLKKILELSPDSKNISLEFRDNSWFNNDVLAEFSRSNIIIVTSYIKGIIPFSLKGQKSYYIRAIGDRELTVFNRIQRKLEMSDDLLESVQKYRNMKEIEDIFIIFNNHFSGFSPREAIDMKKKLGVKFKEFRRQSDLMDFL